MRRYPSLVDLAVLCNMVSSYFLFMVLRISAASTSAADTLALLLTVSACISDVCLGVRSKCDAKCDQNVMSKILRSKYDDKNCDQNVMATKSDRLDWYMLHYFNGVDACAE